MKAEEMLEGMCRSDLTKADSRAICAARGFPSRYASSPDLLEHVFLSDTGVKEALDRLDRNQVLLLHLMNFMGEATDITFFTRIYPKTDMRWDGTFNKEHKEVFKRVKSDLIRKGILLFNTKPKYWGADTVLERQRFLFPREFAALLPPPLATRTIESPRIVPPKKDVLREKLGEILDMESKPDSRSMQGRLHIKDGCLLINKSAFSEKRLRSWNTARWMSSVKVNKRQSSEGISPAKLLYHFLGQLDKDQWFSAHDLGPLLKTAFPDSDLPETGIICEKGLQRGCLAGTIVENTPYYRLNDNDNIVAGRRPEDFLAKVDDSCFTIDIDLAPFKDLELLAEICRLRISSGKLTAEADFVRLNRSLKKAEKEDVFVWLRQNLRQFDNTVKNIKKRRNKIIVHKNIMTARIRDLGLKLLIEKKYGSTGRGGVISLGDEFIAFPRSLLYEIGNLAKKAGHVIKTVSRNDD